MGSRLRLTLCKAWLVLRFRRRVVMFILTILICIRVVRRRLLVVILLLLNFRAKSKFMFRRCRIRLRVINVRYRITIGPWWIGVRRPVVFVITWVVTW